MRNQAMDILLSGAQEKDLQDALLAAFPNKDSLNQMVSEGLNQNLTVIAGGDTLAAIAFSLIDWAQAQSCVDALIEAALQANPGNQALRDVAGDLRVGPDYRRAARRDYAT